MRESEAVRLFHELDLEGKFLYRKRELALLFEEKGPKLDSTIRRLTRAKLLRCIARDVYLWSLAWPYGRQVFLDVADFLRPSEYNYESLESAASRWGIISQVPVGHLMVVTTGAAGEVEIEGMGSIEFVHTDEPLEELLDAQIVSRPDTTLPIASRRRAVDDLTRYGRSLDLVDWEELDDED